MCSGNTGEILTLSQPVLTRMECQLKAIAAELQESLEVRKAIAVERNYSGKWEHRLKNSQWGHSLKDSPPSKFDGFYDMFSVR